MIAKYNVSLNHVTLVVIVNQALLQKFRERFASVLDPLCETFNPVPVAACLLDPTVASILFVPEACNNDVVLEAHI